MSWFNNLFKKKVVELEAEITEPEVVVDPPEGIGEPCISFVKTVQENPRRFKMVSLEETHNFNLGETIRTYKVEDLLFSIVWDITIQERYYYTTHYTFKGFPKWMSKKEKHYVYEKVKEVYSERGKKLKELLDKRGRQYYINKYCN